MSETGLGSAPPNVSSWVASVGLIQVNLNMGLTFDGPGRINTRLSATRFIRTTWLLAASKRLDIDDQSLSIRRVSALECDALVEQACKRNVFARHSWENNFYVQRIKQLREATIVEVLLPGEIDTIIDAARSQAESLERVAFISATLGMDRRRTHQLLAISGHRRYGFDFAISPDFRYMRTSARREPTPRGVPINETFVRRFIRCGFSELVRAVGSGDGLGKRLSHATNWLFESRQEPALQAALVKSAIGLESLLIVNDNENLRGPLSERAAFILADDSPTRRRVAKALKRFYDVRSAIVHGGRSKATSIPPPLLEGVDRLLILVMLALAHNMKVWKSLDGVAAWVDDHKWGSSPTTIHRPFPHSHLARAIQLTERA